MAEVVARGAAAVATKAGAGARHDPAPKPMGIFRAWRLEAYGYTLAAVYASYFVAATRVGAWLIGRDGRPLYRDFTHIFIAGRLALDGHAASIYVARAFVGAQEAVVGAGHALFSIWPYPPIYLLALAPFAWLPYLAAFVAWGLVTLVAAVAVVRLIAGRRPAIALMLASPFTAWNFLAGQSGFLSTALGGAALLALERRPWVAGLFIGALAYKPQFGILFPIALAAARQWRAIAGAAMSFLGLAAVSLTLYGTAPWLELPHELGLQAGLTLASGAGSGWGLLQSVYGAIRWLDGGAATLAWLAQVTTTCGLAAAVWLVWRAPMRYALKAAVLSAAALLATPYAFVYDLAALAIPVAFLARDQIEHGFLAGEQTALVVLFVGSLATIPTLGAVPIGAAVALGVLGLVLRRAAQTHDITASVPNRTTPAGAAPS